MMSSEIEPLQAVPSEADLPDLKLVLSESLSRIDSISDETRSETGDLLNRNTDRKTFNRSLLESMAKQIEAWEKVKPFDLRISQLRGIHKLIAFLERGGNEHNTGYFNQPTGAGKTVLFSLIAFLMNRKTVIFVPKNVLLDQTKQEMISLGIPEESIGIIGEGKNELGKQFQIITYQSHNQKMGENDEYTNDMQTREVVICDEAHRSLGEVTQAKRGSITDVMALRNTDTAFHEARETDESTDVVDEGTVLTDEEVTAEEEFFQHKEDILQSKRKNVLTLGFTATPQMGKKSVHNYFHELIATERYKELVDAGILVPFEIVSTTTSKIYEDELDYIAEKDEGEILRREGVYDKAHIALNRLKKDSKEPIFPVAFCSTHEECLECQSNAKKHGLRCSIVTSYEDKDALGKAERDLLAGKIDEIATVDKLTEGWNLRPLNCAMILRASQSPARIVQGAGRTSRSFSGSTYIRQPNTYTLHKSLDKKKSFIIEPKWVRMMRDTNGDDDGSGKKKTSKGDRKDEQSADRTEMQNESNVAEESSNYHVSSGSKPLTFAEAMALSGQDPSGFVTNQDGAEIAFTIEISTDKLYNGRQIWTIPELMAAHPKTDSVALFAKMREQQIQSIPHLVCKKRSVYDREALEKLLPCEKVEVMSTASTRENDMKTGKLEQYKLHQGRPIMTLREFCNIKKMQAKIMKEKIKECGINKVRNFTEIPYFFLDDLEKVRASLIDTGEIVETAIEEGESAPGQEKLNKANEDGEAIIALPDGTSMKVYTTRRALQELGFPTKEIAMLKKIGLQPLPYKLVTYQGRAVKAYLPADVESYKATAAMMQSEAKKIMKISEEEREKGYIEISDQSETTKKYWFAESFENTHKIENGFINLVSKHIPIPKVSAEIVIESKFNGKKTPVTIDSSLYEEKALRSLLPLTIRKGIGVMLRDKRSNTSDVERCSMTFREYYDTYLINDPSVSYEVFSRKIIGRIEPIKPIDIAPEGSQVEEIVQIKNAGTITKISNKNNVTSYVLVSKSGNIEIFVGRNHSVNNQLYWADEIAEVLKAK